MSSRRGWREDGVFFEYNSPCRDSDRHRHCDGRWRGVISLGFDADGRRIRRKVSGKTKAIVQDRLKALHSDVEQVSGRTELHGPARRRRLARARPARPVTQDDQEERERPHPDPGHPSAACGCATDGRRRPPGAGGDGPALLQRRRRHGPQRADPGDTARRGPGSGQAQRGHARRYPEGQAGRPSKSLSLDQASALLAAAEGTRMHAYIALCLATGIRTEEARALRWEHVDFGDPAASPPVPASAAVWRSVRSHGDTKTEKSRRTLALPEMAVNALWAHREQQAGDRAAAGMTWSDRDLVFSTRTGAALDAANVRREFRAACKAAGIGANWTPRELRHSFVSLMSSRRTGRGDRPARGPRELQDDRGGLQARATAGPDDRGRSHGQAIQSRHIPVVGMPRQVDQTLLIESPQLFEQSRVSDLAIC